MVDVKQAAESARAYAREVLGAYDFSLEEVERDEWKGRDVWLITLGFPVQRPAAVQNFESVLRRLRDYKTFVVDAERGETLAMKIHESAF